MIYSFSKAMIVGYLHNWSTIILVVLGLAGALAPHASGELNPPPDCTPTPAPADHFLFLPFNTGTEGDWLARMTSAFDHHNPNYSCSARSQACDLQDRRIVLWNGDEAKPAAIYSVNPPYNVVGYRCFLPGSSRVMARCDTSLGIWGYQSVTDDYSAAFYDGHDGYDWALPSGTRAQILASAPGKVERVALDGLYGYTITIDHLNGYKTKYSHLLPDSLQVSEGSCVEAGDPIASQGKSGSSDYKVHLHFRVLHGDDLTDPFGFCYECIGSPPPDPLLAFNGESSQNLWYGTLPRSVGLPPTRLNLGLT